MYTYKTIIFDLDGTLFKTDTVFIEALREVCLKREIQLQDKEYITRFIGEPMTKICREIFGKNITDIEVESIRDEVRKIEKRMIAQSGMLFEGVVEMLEKLKASGYTLCICSHGSSQYVNNILDTFHIEDKFSFIKSRQEEFTKSQLVKQILDETRCCSAIIVGDTYNDFQAADDTGCISIGVTYGYGCNDYEKSDFVAHCSTDIYDIIMKINSIYPEITQQIMKKKCKSKPLFVGINGVDTSGKSIFTNEISKYLTKSGFKVQIIHLDDFHNPSAIRNKESDPINSYLNNAFNLNRVEKEILEPASLEGFLEKELLLLDLETDEFHNNKSYLIDKDTIVLFEGVLLFREPIDKYFDFRIYIDITFEEVIKRATKRDYGIFGDSVIEKYKTKYIPIQKLYIDKYTPKKKSNIVINNEDYMKPKMEPHLYH